MLAGWKTEREEKKKIARPTTRAAEAGLYDNLAILSKAFFFLAPTVVYGTLLAAYVYAGHSSSDNGTLIKQIYDFTFASFRDARFSIPIFDLDLDTITQALENLAELFEVDVWELGPEVLLNNAQGFLTLNVLASCLKPLMSASTAILAAANTVSPNVPTSKLARDATLRNRDGPEAHQAIPQRERHHNNSGEQPCLAVRRGGVR